MWPGHGSGSAGAGALLGTGFTVFSASSAFPLGPLAHSFSLIELSSRVLCLLHDSLSARLSRFLPIVGVSDEEDQKPVRLPLRVPVELQPRNNHAWARVQSLAQNPRLR